MISAGWSTCVFLQTLFLVLYSFMVYLGQSSARKGIVAIGWLVGCFGFNGSLRQYSSLYRAVSQRERERGERID